MTTRPERPERIRQPSQQRSRDRVERMLAVATQLIADRGSDALRMNDVAEGAGVSIGSLYQYFPDKSAIVRTLAERCNAEGLACTAAEYANIKTETEVPAAMSRVVDGYYEMFLNHPVMRDIWSATQADKALQDVDAADGAAHTAALFAVFERVWPSRNRKELETMALLLTQITATVVRLAITFDRARGDEVVATFKRLVVPNLLRGLEGTAEEKETFLRAEDCL